MEATHTLYANNSPTIGYYHCMYIHSVSPGWLNRTDGSPHGLLHVFIILSIAKTDSLHYSFLLPTKPSQVTLQTRPGTPSGLFLSVLLVTQ